MAEDDHHKSVLEGFKKHATAQHWNLLTTLGISEGLNDDRIVCVICRRAYYTSDGGCNEKVVIAPCGHHFGKNCIEQWLRTTPDNPSCPMCRYEMKFSCGHIIKPAEAFTTPPPPAPIQSADIERCLGCQRADLDGVYGRKLAHWVVQMAQLNATSGQQNLGSNSAPPPRLPLHELFHNQTTGQWQRADWHKLTATQQAYAQQKMTECEEAKERLEEDLQNEWHISLP